MDSNSRSAQSSGGGAADELLETYDSRTNNIHKQNPFHHYSHLEQQQQNLLLLLNNTNNNNNNNPDPLIPSSASSTSSFAAATCGTGPTTMYNNSHFVEDHFSNYSTSNNNDDDHLWPPILASASSDLLGTTATPPIIIIPSSCSSSSHNQLNNKDTATATPTPAVAPGSSSSDQMSNKLTRPKKRSRASRRAPTIVLTTDTSNFRAMVQEFTGFPAPPFATMSSSSAAHAHLLMFPTSSRSFDLFGGRSSSSDKEPSTSATYLLRPFAHRPTPAPFNNNNYQLPSSSINNAGSSSSSSFARAQQQMTTTTTTDFSTALYTTTLSSHDHLRLLHKYNSNKSAQFRSNESSTFPGGDEFVMAGRMEQQQHHHHQATSSSYIDRATQLLDDVQQHVEGAQRESSSHSVGGVAPPQAWNIHHYS